MKSEGKFIQLLALAIIAAVIYFVGPWIVETAKELFENLENRGSNEQQQLRNVGD
jgi:predicted PurR-regulated permease PerM